MKGILLKHLTFKKTFCNFVLIRNNNDKQPSKITYNDCRQAQ